MRVMLDEKENGSKNRNLVTNFRIIKVYPTKLIKIVAFKVKIKLIKGKDGKLRWALPKNAIFNGKLC